MNKTINQYINQLNLDPKKEAAVRKLVENAGGVNDSTPLVESLVGNELLPIKQDGKNKAVKADELVKGGKEVFILTPDMFEGTATVLENPYPGLIFTEDAWSEFKEAVWGHKIIGISMALFQYISDAAVPFSAVSDNYAFSTYVSRHSADSYSLTFEIVNEQLDIDRYEVFITDKQIDSIKNIMPDGHFIIDETMFTASIADDPITSFELTDKYKQFLMIAISTKKVIGISNLALYYLVESINVNNVITRGLLPTGFSIINISQSAGIYFKGHVYYGIDNILLRIFCLDGVITVEKETMLHGNGDGTKFLSDDGSYKEAALAPYIWNGTTSETIYKEIVNCITSNRTIIYRTTDVNDESFYYTCTAAVIDTPIIYLTFSHTYQHGTFIMIVMKEQVLKIQGLIPFHEYSDNANIYIEAGRYENINIKRNVEIIHDSPETNGVQQQYEGELIFGDTLYTITFPANIKWSTDSVLEYKANHTYQFRIVNNLGVMKEFANDGGGSSVNPNDILYYELNYGSVLPNLEILQNNIDTLALKSVESTSTGNFISTYNTFVNVEDITSYNPLSISGFNIIDVVGLSFIVGEDLKVLEDYEEFKDIIVRISKDEYDNIFSPIS